MKFYKFYTAGGIFKDTAVINCINFQHKNVYLQSTLIGHTLLLAREYSAS
jgi:hypothetical protein